MKKDPERGEQDHKHQAVALKYQRASDKAPRITAKGQGLLADKIIEIAKAHNILVHEDPDMIEILSQLDLNAEIPTDLYAVVAELLAFVYGLNREKASS